MKYYITDKLNVANTLINLLNTEVIDALDRKVYMVEEVDASYPDKKFEVLNSAGNHVAWVRLLTSARITTKYAEIKVHPSGTQYAIPILAGLKYYDIEQRIIDTALSYGSIVNELTPDWETT